MSQRSAHTLTSKISVKYKNLTLIEYLCRRFTYQPREKWLERIGEKRFLVDGVLASAETHLTQGAIVSYDVPPFPQPDANFDYSIIYEDEWLLAINKPANLRVHGEGRYMMANLSYHLWYKNDPPYPNAKLINRLDSDTSGVVLFAKDPAMAREMGWLFERRQVEKTYLALVHGTPEADAGIIDLPIGKIDNPKYAKKGRIPRSIVNAPKSRDAVTGYAVLKHFSTKPSPILTHKLSSQPDNSHTITLLRLTPKTGRTHQLRVHLVALGCPIVGDRLYLLDDEQYVDWRENRDKPHYADLLGRQALHSASTAFIHPITKEQTIISAPLAADIQLLLATLGS